MFQLKRFEGQQILLKNLSWTKISSLPGEMCVFKKPAFARKLIQVHIQCSSIKWLRFGSLFCCTRYSKNRYWNLVKIEQKSFVQLLKLLPVWIKHTLRACSHERGTVNYPG